jgi:hypothetical protein
MQVLVLLVRYQLLGVWQRYDWMYRQKSGSLALLGINVVEYLARQL